LTQAEGKSRSVNTSGAQKAFPRERLLFFRSKAACRTPPRLLPKSGQRGEDQAMRETLRGPPGLEHFRLEKALPAAWAGGRREGI